MSRFGIGLVGGGLDQFTKALLHFDGDLADAAKPSRVWTARGSAGSSPSSFKFGTASLNCGSQSGRIDTPDDTDWTLGSGDFTVDCWFNLTADHPAGAAFFFGTADSSNTLASNSFQVSRSSDAAGGALNFSVVTGGSTVSQCSTSGNIGYGVGWRHCAGVRSGSTLMLFLGGVLQASHAVSGSVNDPARFAIGGNGADTTHDMQGFIDEFRLSVGIARWTANFTPPTSPYS